MHLGMQQRVLVYQQICENDAPVLTLAYFTARSNLVPYAFVWEKVKTLDFSETIASWPTSAQIDVLFDEHVKYESTLLGQNETVVVL